MRTRTLELTVGLFILAGLLALLILALRVSGLTLSTNGDTYTVYAHFDNVSGLTSRSKVTMAGVTIGQVKRITFDRTGIPVWWKWRSTPMWTPCRRTARPPS